MKQLGKVENFKLTVLDGFKIFKWRNVPGNTRD